LSFIEKFVLRVCVFMLFGFSAKSKSDAATPAAEPASARRSLERFATRL
jgi:hypothetical protein